MLANIKRCEHLLNHASDSVGYNALNVLPVKGNCIAETKKSRQALQLFFHFVLFAQNYEVKKAILNSRTERLFCASLCITAFVMSMENLADECDYKTSGSNPAKKNRKSAPSIRYFQTCPNQLLHFLGESLVFDPFNHLTASSVSVLTVFVLQ